MRVVVVGAGVMGLAAARVLAERGHDVVALDRFGVGSRLASSPGPTRIWRLAHPDRSMVRLARRAVDTWHDLERRSGRTLLLETGLLWRGQGADGVLAALVAEGADASPADPVEQARRFPELRPDPDELVVWQPEAGAVLAADGLAVQAELLVRAGGRLVAGEVVRAVEPTGSGAVVVTGHGRYDVDVVVLAAGPWSTQLLPGLGIDLPLEPMLEQVSYVAGPPGWDTRPAVIEGLGTAGAHYYAMPTPGIGYKIGIDDPLRAWDADDLDRTPSPERAAAVEELVRSDFPGFAPRVLRSDVCSWTASPDERFVLDRVGPVVVGCGDSGQAFKFSPLLGEVLADLAEDRPLDPDAAQFALARFG